MKTLGHFYHAHFIFHAPRWHLYELAAYLLLVVGLLEHLDRAQRFALERLDELCVSLVVQIGVEKLVLAVAGDHLELTPSTESLCAAARREVTIVVVTMMLT